MGFWSNRAAHANEARTSKRESRAETRAEKRAGRIDKFNRARIDRGERTPFRSSTFVTRKWGK